MRLLPYPTLEPKWVPKRGNENMELFEPRCSRGHHRCFKAQNIINMGFSLRSGRNIYTHTIASALAAHRHWHLIATGKEHLFQLNSDVVIANDSVEVLCPEIIHMGFSSSRWPPYIHTEHH